MPHWGIQISKSDIWWDFFEKYVKISQFAAQNDPSMIVFFGWSVNKDGHPSPWLASTFLAELRSKTCL